MPLEDLTGPDKFPDALNEAWPLNADDLTQGNNHIFGVKNVIKNWAADLGASALKGQIEAMIADLAVPAGAYINHAGATPPTGYLKCDGSAISRTTYAKLFAVISDTYGVGDGTTTFNLPSFVNGEFMRATGGAAEAQGTLQAEAIGVHTHTATQPAHSHAVTGGNHVHNSPPHAHAMTQQNLLFAAGGGAAFNMLANSGATSTTSTAATIDASGNLTIACDEQTPAITVEETGTESRPINQSVLVCIKY